MSQYIHFTDEQKAQARQTDIVSLLKSQGETVKRSGSEYEWKDGSQKVTIRGNLWYHQYGRVGGDAIDFVRRFYNKSYPEAMEYLLGNCNGVLITAPPVVKEKKPFELPKPYRNMDRVKNYLHYVRGIDKDIIEIFADKNMIYESADYHNAVFVGFDKMVFPDTPTSVVSAEAVHSREMPKAVWMNLRFTASAKANIFISLKHR